jgi:hypothetical protein
MIKFVYDYYVKKNKKHPKFSTILFFIIIIPSMIKVSNLIDNYVPAGLGYYIVIALLGISYLNRLLLKIKQNFNYKYVIYIGVTILNIVVTYSMWEYFIE